MWFLFALLSAVFAAFASGAAAILPAMISRSKPSPNSPRNVSEILPIGD